jgi:hypothetical protein
MRNPVTRADWPTDKTALEFSVVGDVAAPTAVTDANVYPIPLVRQSIADTPGEVQEVEEFWQFQFRTSAADSDASVILWFHNYRLDEWYPSALLEIKGTSLLDLAHGGVFSMAGVLGCDYIGVQVTGHAGKTLYLAHMWS